MASLRSYFNGKQVLVTGGTGSIGSHIVERALKHGCRVVRVLSRDESKQFELAGRLQSKSLECVIGDVRDLDAVRGACRKVNYIFHAAALKHVPACEAQPLEALQTNVLGAANVARAAAQARVSKVIGISTDKAVMPENAMGATKFLMERLFLAADTATGDTVFAVVRFGNVLGSRGSLVPHIVSLIERGGPVTLTDPQATRFFMSIPEAAKLTFQACRRAQGGELFILKMSSVRIKDLVELLIERSGRPGIEVKVTGLRPGERLHEYLMTGEESSRAEEFAGMYVVKPRGRSRRPPTAVCSDDEANLLDRQELDRLLKRSRVYPSDWTQGRAKR